MNPPAEDTWVKRAGLGCSLAAAALLICGATRNWIAAHRLYSGKLASIERGAALESGNANGWDRLGRVRQADFADSDPGAIADFRQALRDNPRCWYCWTDLAQAYDAAGQYQQAEDSFRRAELVYPASAEIVWFYGNFLLREQKYTEAFAEIRRAVQSDRKILPVAISRAWRATGDVNQLINGVIPPEPDAYLQALDFFTSESQFDAGMAVWRRLVSLRESFALSRTFAFLDGLIHADRSDDAGMVWREALDLMGSPLREEPRGSLVWNGQFTENFINGGLGWRWTDPPGAEVGFDAPPTGEPGRSLRVDFSGGVNLDLNQPAQMVPVQPAQTYIFSARMRTEGISTESGMRFLIADPNHPGEASATTDNLTGTHAWTDVRAKLTTGTETHFLEIRLFRPPSMLFDSQIAGTVWVADVALTPALETEHGSR